MANATWQNYEAQIVTQCAESYFTVTDGERFLSRFKAFYKIFLLHRLFTSVAFLHFTDDDVDERCIHCVQWCIHEGLMGLKTYSRGC